ncbi:fibrinogen-binding adhesin SdrG C-terminal domain-containing protein, partial [Anaerococcus tetradius]
MKYEQQLKEFVESKKNKSTNRKPRYATRKLSIGLVSCLLGFITFVAMPQGQIAYADGSSQPAIVEKAENVENPTGGGTQADVKPANDSSSKKENDIKKEEEAKADANANANAQAPQALTAEPKKQDSTQTGEKKEAETKKQETTVSEAEKKETGSEKDKAVSKEEKKQEEKDPKETENKEDKDKSKKPEDKKDEDKDKEDKAKAEDREATGDEAQTGQDVSDKLENLITKIRANANSPEGSTVTPLRSPVNDNEGKDVGLDISFDVPATVKEGDYFEIKLSDTLNGYGATSKDVVYDPYLYVGNDVVAKGIYDPASNTFKYVFTKDAEKYGKFHQDINEVVYIDPKKVPNSTPDVDIFATLGSHNIANKVNVDYSLGLEEGDTDIDSNGAGTINELDSKNGHYEQTFYVNYAGKTQHGTELTFKNDDKAEDYGKITESKAVFDQDVLDSVKVYRVKDPNKLNSSFDVDASDPNLEELKANEYTKEIIPVENGLKIKFNNEGSTDTYVVKYKGKYDSKKFVQIKSKVIADPTKPYVTATHSSNVSLTSAKSAPKADIGKFMEFHVYQTLNEDGTVKTTDYASDPENFSSGNTQQTYTTEKKDRPGYEIYKVDRPDGAVADEFGNKITSNFRAGKKDVVTYYYRKIQPNHTVWIDEEGKDVKNVENGLKEKGDTPAGYTFVESKENEKQKDGSTKNTHIYHKIITNWVEENTGKVLKTKEDGAKPDTEGDDIKDYHKVDIQNATNGDVTNIYHKIITKWIEENTNKVLRGPEDGSKPDNDNVWDIPEYKLVRTETNPNTGDVTNIYKKIDVNYTAWVDEEGNRIKQPVKDLKEKGADPAGYKFTKTTEIKDEDNGTTTRIHHYHKIVTKWIEDKTKKTLQDPQDGAKPDTDGNDIAEYKYLRTKVDDETGDVTNIYHKIVTNWKENITGDVLKTQKEGELPDTDGNDIENYKWIRTETDPDTGDITNYYHKIKTYWVEMGTGDTLKKSEDGAHPDDDGLWDIPNYGLVGRTVNPDTGDVTNIYKKIVPPYTVWVDEEGKQIKNPEDGLKEKGKDPEGYKFVKSKEKEQLPDGGMKNTHTYHKIVTRWVEDGKNDPLKDPEDGAHPDKEGDDLKDYYLVITKEEGNGDILNVYSQRTTSYVDEGGDEIPGNPTENGVKDKKPINDYEFVKTRTDKNGNVTHVYKKVVKPKTVWEDEDGNPVKDPKEGTEEKGEDPDGYKYLRTKDGDKQRTHVYHKIVTKWIEDKTGEVLKEKTPGKHPDDEGDDIENYVIVTTIVDNETGDVTNVYKKKTPKTSYVDENGKPIPKYPTEDGEKEKKEIPGYSYQGKEKDKDGNTVHKYHKIVTKYVDEDGKEIPNNPQEDGEKDPKVINGYEHKETKVDEKTKDRTHVYKKKTPKTSYVDENGKPIPKYPTVDGEKDKEDIPGYSYLGKEKDKDGNTVHKYHKIVTKYVDEDGKEIPNNPQEDGEKDPKDITGYEHKETKVDEKTKDRTHVYKKKTPKTSYVDENGKPIPNTPSEDGEKEKIDIPGYSYQGKEK